MVLLALFIGKRGGGGLGEEVPKFGHACKSMLCMEFHTPCVLRQKKKGNKKAEGCCSNGEQRRTKMTPAVNGGTWDEMESSSIKSQSFSKDAKHSQTRTLSHIIRRQMDSD